MTTFYAIDLRKTKGAAHPTPLQVRNVTSQCHAMALGQLRVRYVADSNAFAQQISGIRIDQIPLQDTSSSSRETVVTFLENRFLISTPV